MGEKACPVEITSTLVESLVADQFPDWSGRLVRRVEPGGWDNRTFRLGDDLLVRLPSHARYVAQVAKEQHWLPFLGRSLPLPIPEPVALGQPALGYPWPWSVYRWLEGEPASGVNLADETTFAEDLADFLRGLQAVDPSGGPPPGEHNFFRGGSLLTYDQDTRRAQYSETPVASMHDATSAAGVEPAVPRLSVLGLEAAWLGHGTLAQWDRHVVDFRGLEQLVPGPEEVMVALGSEVGQATRAAHPLQLLGPHDIKGSCAGSAAFAIRGLDHD